MLLAIAPNPHKGGAPTRIARLAQRGGPIWAIDAESLHRNPDLLLPFSRTSPALIRLADALSVVFVMMAVMGSFFIGWWVFIPAMALSLILGGLARWLAEPEKMLAEKDPIVMELHAKYKNVPMPNMRLNEVEVASLIDYMDRQESQNGGGATDRARLLRSARELRGSLDSLHGSLARQHSVGRVPPHTRYNSNCETDSRWFRHSNASVPMFYTILAHPAPLQPESASPSSPGHSPVQYAHC